MTVLYRAGPDAEGGHTLLGPGGRGSMALELVGDPDGQVPPPFAEEDRLVLYLGVPAGGALIERLVRAAGKSFAPGTSTGTRWGVTIADPDGYRLVLSHQTWE